MVIRPGKQVPEGTLTPVVAHLCGAVGAVSFAGHTDADAFAADAALPWLTASGHIPPAAAVGL
ncbi:hypothetical protein ACFRKB_28945 [Streptomyces scopuliridis]|uniref:hypothetical protein n=1 Tax=Streptomyces scopuliridis TaxID=452529 RepID=UPI0036D06BF2